MKKIELLAMLGESKDIIDYLQRKGTVQVEKCDAPESMYYTDTDSSVSQLERLLQTAENARETISFYSPEKKKLTDSFLPRKEVELSDFYEESEKTDVAMAKCREIIDIKKEIADKKADIIREQTAREALIPWERLDIPPNTTGTRHTEVFVGSLPDECTEEALKAGFAEALPDLTAIDCEVVSSSNTQSIIVVICLKKDSRRVYDYLRSLNFVRAPGGDNENIKAAMERHGKNIEALSSDIDGDEEKIRELSSYREDIDFLIDFLTIRKDKYEAFKKMSLSRNVFYFEGYIPERYCEKTVKGLEERFTVAVTISDVPEDDENEPVLLKNNDFAAPVEEITEMYALPGKHDIDPNAIMAFFYYCFFGMMFSDAGYGLIMFLATLFILLKCKPEGQKRKTVMMYMYCGISTMFWGIMFGSFFGDIINIVRYDFIGLPKIRLYAWLDPQEQLMTTMLWCFLFGVVHLFVGVGIKGYMEWRDGQRFWAVCDTLSVYLAVGGALPLCAGMIIDVPADIKTVGKYCAIAGVIIIVLTAGRESKSFFGKIGSGLYAVYNTISGYLSDILSYARLLALGLVTGIIGSVVNMMGALPSNKVAKAIVLAVVFVFGHAVNFGINVIGAYVHTNRLQYVEFFSKFYNGGGKKFTPLKANSKTFKFKEEISNG